ncbi:Retrotransposon protein [Nesidiocoris tenuis]|nr:Retrotransposon protein [Nesidiocoris tenuis]
MHSGAAKDFMGPFDTIIKQPFICEDEGTREIYLNETIIRKTGKRSFTLSTKVYLTLPFSDDLQIKANFAVWGNGGWRPNFLTLTGPACSLFRDRAPDLFIEAAKASNLPEECPIANGHYDWVGIDAMPKIDIEQLPYNKYKIDIEFYNDGILVGCIGFITLIVPKEKKSG